MLRPGASPSLNPFYDSVWTYVLSPTDPGLVCRYDSKGGFLVAHAYLVPPPASDFNQLPTFGYNATISLRMIPPQPASFFIDCLQNVLLEVDTDVATGAIPLEFRFIRASLEAAPATTPAVDVVPASVLYTRPAGAPPCPPPATGTNAASGDAAASHRVDAHAPATRPPLAPRPPLVHPHAGLHLRLWPYLFNNFCSVFRKTVEVSPGVFRAYDITPFLSLVGDAGPDAAAVLTVEAPGTDEAALGWARCVNCKAGGMTAGEQAAALVERGCSTGNMHPPGAACVHPADTATGPNSVDAFARAVHWGPGTELPECLLPLYSGTLPGGPPAAFLQATVLIDERGRDIVAEVLPGRVAPEALALVPPVSVDSAAVAACLRAALNMTTRGVDGHLMVPLPLPDGVYPLTAHAGGVESADTAAAFMQPLPVDCEGHTFVIPPAAPRALPLDLVIAVPPLACTCPAPPLAYTDNIGAASAISGRSPPLAPPSGATTVGVSDVAYTLCSEGFPLSDGAPLVCPPSVVAEHVSMSIRPDTATVPGVVSWSDIVRASARDPTRTTRAVCTYVPTGSRITVGLIGVCYPPLPQRCTDPNVWYGVDMTTNAATVFADGVAVGSNVVAAAEAFDACAAALWVDASAPATTAQGIVTGTIRVTLGINATVDLRPAGSPVISMVASVADSSFTYVFPAPCAGC